MADGHTGEECGIGILPITSGVEANLKQALIQ
jgi:hypothetical protein